MKKLEVTLNNEAENNWDHLNISYSENEKTIDEKSKEVFHKIKNDEIKNPQDLHNFMVENFSQEETVLLAGMYFGLKWRNIEKEAIKEARKRTKKKRSNFPQLEALDRLKELAKMLEKLEERRRKSKTEVFSNDREDFLEKLRIQISERGVELNMESLRNASNKEEFMNNLKDQFGDGFDIDRIKLTDDFFKDVPKPEHTETK